MTAPNLAWSPEGVAARLAAPFPAAAVKWKPGKVSGNRALAVPYIDCRAIQDRLDEVVGVAGWQDDYEVLPEGLVVCRLSLRLGTGAAGDWITKVDVGCQSKQPDAGDRGKSAFSAALKRAAVKFGIGRYLGRVGSQWADYDPARKCLVKPPPMPPEFLPEAERPQKTPPRAKPKEAPALQNNGHAKPQAEQKAPDPRAAEPRTGPGLAAWLTRVDAALVEAWPEVQTGELARLVESRVRLATQGLTAPLAEWRGPAVEAAVRQGEQVWRELVLKCKADRAAKAEQETAAAGVITTAQLRVLEGLLREVKARWPAVAKACGIDPETEPGALTVPDWKAACTFLTAAKQG